MKVFRLHAALFALLLIFLVPASLAEVVTFDEQGVNGKKVYSLSNAQIRLAICFESGQLQEDTVTALPEWLSKFRGSPLALTTDADFLLDIMWTGWSAPGKENNAENPVFFSKKDFLLAEQTLRELSGGSKELDLIFKGKDVRFELKITYQLEPGSFYARRKLAIRDARNRNHFLRWIWPSQLMILGELSAVKSGGFGQPVAFRFGQGGAFFGLEYPTSTNLINLKERGKVEIRCGQEIGERIGNSWIESEWVVEGLSPDSNVKLWFSRYLERIRVAPLRPYLLYNTWYDLRAPEMVKDQARALNEENILRTIASFRKRMFEERGLNLDAFVLDDGWDVYRSDWALNSEQFPRGLTPLAEALKSMGTRLGMWLGPIGGYSHRDWRVGFMRSQGYETVGDQMCVAGDRYRQLLKKRVVDFVQKDGVGYFKWDGIQFSCSEANHGHLPDIYSRRAVMQSVIELCQSVRRENPEIFLNVTSGTWLSPWWLKYANTLWMQGSDYGYANVPSISRRDRAITYRDFVLFEDLRKQEFWFPIANLMTHGVIKGELETLGERDEPLDKFSDDVLLYLARGISMWELYISPALLTDHEWDSLAAAIRWAKDRFPTLCLTEMVGGDPGELKPYGYVHFQGKRGIVAARNPFIEEQALRLVLSPSFSLDPEASSLVVEKVYPNRFIFRQLQRAGSAVELPLQGYETAVYEIYPLEEAKEPLVAGVTFDVLEEKDGYKIGICEREKGGRLFNPEKVKGATINGKKVKPKEILLPAEKLKKPVSNASVQASSIAGGSEVGIHFVLRDPALEATLAVLLEPSGKSIDAEDPVVVLNLNGSDIEAKVENQKGRWGWYRVDVKPGEHKAQIKIVPGKNMNEWTGSAYVWLVCLEKPQAIEVSFELAQKIVSKRPMPPKPWPAGVVRKNIKLGKVEVRAVK
jgi:hypothetical protein